MTGLASLRQNSPIFAPGDFKKDMQAGGRLTKLTSHRIVSLT
jgi:hypothetical protein